MSSVKDKSETKQHHEQEAASRNERLLLSCCCLPRHARQSPVRYALSDNHVRLVQKEISISEVLWHGSQAVTVKLLTLLINVRDARMRNVVRVVFYLGEFVIGGTLCAPCPFCTCQAKHARSLAPSNDAAPPHLCTNSTLEQSRCHCCCLIVSCQTHKTMLQDAAKSFLATVLLWKLFTFTIV